MEQQRGTATAELETSMVTIQIIPSVSFGEGKLHAQELSEGVQDFAEVLKDRYIVRVEKNAPGQCMDGRFCKCCVSAPATIIGPKCAGGPLQSGFGAAELTPGYYGARSGQTPTERAVEVGETITANGIVIGGHTTEGALGNGFVNPETKAEQTGCGAGESHPKALRRVARRDANVVATSSALTQANHDDASVVSVDTIERNVAGYSAKDMYELEHAQSEGRSMEILAGSHEESVVVLNWVRGTTIDRDALYTETGKEAFVIDMWYLQDIARAMTDGRPDAEEMFQAVYSNMVEYQLAVYAELCDGSHPVIMFKGDYAPAA